MRAAEFKCNWLDGSPNFNGAEGSYDYNFSAMVEVTGTTEKPIPVWVQASQEAIDYLATKIEFVKYLDEGN